MMILTGITSARCNDCGHNYKLQRHHDCDNSCSQNCFSRSVKLVIRCGW